MGWNTFAYIYFFPSKTQNVVNVLPTAATMDTKRKWKRNNIMNERTKCTNFVGKIIQKRQNPETRWIFLEFFFSTVVVFVVVEIVNRRWHFFLISIAQINTTDKNRMTWQIKNLFLHSIVCVRWFSTKSFSRSLSHSLSLCRFHGWSMFAIYSGQRYRNTTPQVLSNFFFCLTHKFVFSVLIRNDLFLNSQGIKSINPSPKKKRTEVAATPPIAQ